MKNTVGKILLVTLSVLVTMVLFETFLRITGYKNREIGFLFICDSGYYQPDSDLIYTIRPTMINPPGHVFANSLSIKESPFKQREIKHDDTTIVILGDSFVWGNTADDKTYPAQLERLLSGTGKRFMVLNAGASGYGTDQEYLLFRDKILPYVKPKFVVWNINVNDIEDIISRPIIDINKGSLSRISAWRNGVYLDGLLARKLPDYLRKNSKVINLISSHLEQLRLVYVPKPETAWALEKIRLEIIGMKQLAQQNGFQLIVAISPSQEIVENGQSKQTKTNLVSRIKSAVGDKDIIDQNISLMEDQSPLNTSENSDVPGTENLQSYFLDESSMFPRGYWHPNDAGNYIMANSIYQRISSILQIHN